MFSETFLRSPCPPVFEFYFLKVSRLDVAKQKRYTLPSNRFHGPEISKSWNFPKYWRWWRVQAFKITKFVRWRDFNVFRRAYVPFTWLVDWLHPKSNIVYTGNCWTKGGRSIRALSNFDLDFRDNKWCILKKFWDHCVPPVVEFHFLKRSWLDVAKQKRYMGPSIRFHEAEFLKILNVSKILTLVRESGL